MSTKDFLVEIGTEELPPVALGRLSEAFENGIMQGLAALGFEGLQSQRYATPRRLAVLVSGVPVTQADQMIERRGPSLQAAFDADNKPTKAAEGFARSCGVSVDALEQIDTGKGQFLFYKTVKPGEVTEECLPDIVSRALAGLPIPKRMRWGDSDAEFVRPVHWLVMLFGSEAVQANILGVDSGNQTFGHRFHYPASITLEIPSDYPGLLYETGKVVVGFADRREKIKLQLGQLAKQLNGHVDLEADDELLSEVTALVEWPVAIACRFDKHFLQVPAEALVSTMKSNQKYFPVYDHDGKLTENFITISNLESLDLEKVRQGNERVIRPRLADAAFFWDQDRKQSLSIYNERLKAVVFQTRLGSVYDKAARVASLAGIIATRIKSNVDAATRAGLLCKADLMTEMVGEFPKLQGIMGRYYALHDGEPEAVALAIEEHYKPRFAGDHLPDSEVGQCVAIADKLDTLTGIYAVGLKPTGDKDPYALRRAALGLLKIMVEKSLPLDLLELLQQAAAQFSAEVNAPAVVDEVFEFIMNRLRAEYEDKASQAYTPQQVDAVMACGPTRPVDFDQRIQAVRAFTKLPESEALAAANKRIANILKKTDGSAPGAVDQSLLQEPAEQTLYARLQKLLPEVEPLSAEGKYEQALVKLAGLHEPVDKFFDAVLVMDEDIKLRANRLALLNSLHGAFTRIADISRLQQ